MAVFLVPGEAVHKLREPLIVLCILDLGQVLLHPAPWQQVLLVADKRVVMRHQCHEILLMLIHQRSLAFMTLHVQGFDLCHVELYG